MTVPWTQADLLENPIRAAIMAEVSASPGITFRALARRVDATFGTVRHHLNMLLRSRLVREEFVGCRVAIMRADDGRNATVLTTLLEPGMQALRDLVASAGRICQRDLLSYMEGIWPRSTTQNRLDRLVKAGAVGVCRQGRFLFYEVAA